MERFDSIVIGTGGAMLKQIGTLLTYQKLKLN